MPNEYAYSKMFFERWYRPQYTTVIIAGDVDAGAGAAARREVLGRVEGGDRRRRRAIPTEPPPTGPQYVHVPWASDTLPWVTRRVSRAGVRRERQGLGGRRDARPLSFGETSDLYKKLVVTEQKVDQLQVDVPVELRSVAVHGAGAREERRPMRCTSAIRFWRPSPRPSARRHRAAAGPPRGREVEHRYSFARTIDSTERVAAVAVGVRVVQALVPDGQQLLPHARVADASRSVRRRPRKYFADRRPDRDDAVEGSAAGRHRAGAGADRRCAAPAAGAGGRRSRRRRRSRPSGRTGRRATLLDDRQVVLQKSPSPLVNVKLLFTVGLGARSGGQGRTRGADRGDDDRRGLEGDDDRSDRRSALSDRGLVRCAHRQGDDDR